MYSGDVLREHVEDALPSAGVAAGTHELVQIVFMKADRTTHATSAEFAALYGTPQGDTIHRTIVSTLGVAHPNPRRAFQFSSGQFASFARRSLYALEFA